MIYFFQEYVTGRAVGNRIMNRGRSLKWILNSSSGYAQIFAFVAINAVNFAVERGLTTYATLVSLGTISWLRIAPRTAGGCGIV